MKKKTHLIFLSVSFNEKNQTLSFLESKHHVTLESGGLYTTPTLIFGEFGHLYLLS